MGRLISKFFIYDSVAPNKTNSHHFKNMIIGAQQAGMGIEPPSPYEIKNKYLEMEYKDMEDYVIQQREKWKIYGCTIMSDGWTRPTRLSIINFMAYSKESTVFLKLVDASNNIKDHKYIYKLLKNVIKEVGVDNVVQIAIDNGSAFVKVGKLLMKKFNLYWTPCAAHCINLMLEDIGKRPSIVELVLFRDAKRGFGDRAAVASRSTMVPENDRVAEKDYFDLLNISVKVGEKEENRLFQWVKPIHLDDEVGNPDPRIAAHAQEFEVDVERVLSEEVHSESFSKDTEDSFQGALNSHQEVDSTSIGQSSRPSAVGTSASGYDGSRGETDDGSDHVRGDIGERQQSQYPMSQFTCENNFTHCTQDEDHGSRRVGPDIGAIGKPNRGREWTMTPYNEELLSGIFESMSIGTQFSDFSNEANVYPLYVMGYGQPSSSTDEEYGMLSYPLTA
ncbi:hypothetical protein CK203_046415 [Vitis vinifera]|uniref:DUF659 domain-containing protein n=1 Tax=Vitis vinifera TaxID=29760 RepID=A0A438I220_VITVI|nr:hypothetical protein CK203_046415 [Vitis vinifera]